MKLRVNIGVILFFILQGNGVLAQETIKAKIVSKIVDNFVDISAIAQNSDATYKSGFTYLFLSLKKGEGKNYSRNQQSGEFSLNPNEEKKISSLKINIQAGEECRVYFFIRKNDKLISKDSTIIFSVEKGNKKKFVEENDIEIVGLVVEDVKTKLGKDFYDYFYQKYMSSGAKYPFIVHIDEKPSIGRGSKITIDVDDRIIFQFMTRPSDEYIQSAANQALRYVSNYATQRRLLYKNKKF